MKTLITLVLSFFLLMTSTAFAINPIVIDNDNGGLLTSYEHFYKAIKDSGVPVILRGICISGCTLVLSLPKSQVCVEPTASLGLHLAKKTDEEHGEKDFTDVLYHRYSPPVIQEWIENHPLKDEVTFISAKELKEMGVFDYCK